VARARIVCARCDDRDPGRAPTFLGYLKCDDDVPGVRHLTVVRRIGKRAADDMMVPELRTRVGYRDTFTLRADGVVVHEVTTTSAGIWPLSVERRVRDVPIRCPRCGGVSHSSLKKLIGLMEPFPVVIALAPNVQPRVIRGWWLGS
jgi:hypothetical protein